MPNDKLKPDFLLIGAQKAGTSWLFYHLKAHDQVFMPEPKEQEFFSRTQNNSPEMFAQKYLRVFEGAGNAKAIGEATPSYFWSQKPQNEWTAPFPKGFEKNIPAAVQRLLGQDIRLLLSLRNPVERAISAYLHHLRRNRLTTADDILTVGKRFGIIHMGFYSRHLAAWLKHFDLEQFKIILFEEMMADKTGTLEEIFEFIGVSTCLPEDVEQSQNEGLPRKRDGHAVLITDEEGQQHEVVSEQDYRKLERIYRPDVERLSEVLGRDLRAFWFG